MKLIHYSKDDSFTPKARETVPGFGKGCFFYPEGKEVEWSGRNRFEFEAPDAVVEEVQEFSAAESGVGHKVVELFVSAKNLKLVRPA